MTIRSSSQSIYYLFAELLAAPFSSIASFDDCIDSLGSNRRSIGDGAGDVTARGMIQNAKAEAFWRKIEAEMLAKSPEFTVDELVSMRDWIWFRHAHADSRSNTDLFDYLRDSAQQNLHDTGSIAIPLSSLFESRNRPSTGNNRQSGRIQWRWITRTIPQNLLSSTLLDVGTVDPMMKSIGSMLFDQGFAETHLHLGASYSFAQLWITAMNVVASPVCEPSAFESPNAPFQNGKRLAVWLLIACTVRIVLARFLFLRHDHTKFEDFCDSTIRSKGLFDFDQHFLWQKCVLALHNPIENAPPIEKAQFFLPLQTLNRRLRKRQTKMSTDVRELQECDPIAPIIQNRLRTGQECEDIFLSRSFKYIADNNGSDRLFSVLFWQVQRIRCQLFKFITQQQSIRGLVWFTRYYRRISPSRKGTITTGARLHLASLFSGYQKGLRSLEVRISPPNNWNDLLEEVTDLAQMGIRLENGLNNPRYDETSVSRGLLRVGDKLDAELRVLNDRDAVGISNDRTTSQIGFDVENESRIRQIPLDFESGIVLHVVKEREKLTPDDLSVFGGRSHENPRSSADSRYRYGSYFKKIKQQIDATSFVLEQYPLSLQWIRGFDVCNDELSMPTWLFVEFFQQIRDSSIVASRELKRRLNIDVPPIHATAHVGEDFAHLLTGLRRIDEAVEFLDIGEGDRLGHALALGQDPIKWSQSVGSVPMDKITCLFDLVWISNLGRKIADDLPPNFLHDVDIQAVRLIGELFEHWNLQTGKQNGLLPRVHEIEQLRIDAAIPAELRRIGFPDNVPNNIQDPARPRGQRILFDYLCNSQLFRQGRQIELVEPADSGMALVAVQNYLRRKIATRGVVIEVNPTSNVVVGKIPEIAYHPMWRLSNPEYSDEIPEISLCIGSDDPLVFATDLRQEYQYLYDGLLGMDYSDKAIRTWLISVCRNGIDSRFTLSKICNRPIEWLSTN